MEQTPAIVTQTTPTLKLDLGAGGRPKEGFEGVDRFPGENTKHVVNLFKFPWPWADNSVEELHASHFLEHIPMIETDATGKQVEFGEGVDLLMRFMNEAHRVLMPNGKFTIIVPSAHSDRAYQDPTHRRFFVVTTFYYFWKEWRAQQGLEHYMGATHSFAAVNINHSIPAETGTRHVEVQTLHANHYWNGVMDIYATLSALK